MFILVDKKERVSDSSTIICWDAHILGLEIGSFAWQDAW